MTQAKPLASWLTHGAGRSSTCASARGRLLWRGSSRPQAAERMSLASHWPQKGMSRTLSAYVRRDCVGERQGGHRPCIPARWRLMGPLLWLLKRRRWSPPGAWAAPPPSLARTGESTTLRQPFAEDGMRVRHYFSVAEVNRNAAAQSPPRWRLHLNTCVVQPGWVGTWARKSRQNTRRDDAAPAACARRKKHKNPLSGGVCLLTKRGLIRVRCGPELALGTP